MEKVSVDLQRRLGRDEMCDRSIYSGVQPLLWDLGKFSCARTVHEQRAIHCAGNVVQVRATQPHMQTCNSARHRHRRMNVAMFSRGTAMRPFLCACSGWTRSAGVV